MSLTFLYLLQSYPRRRPLFPPRICFGLTSIMLSHDHNLNKQHAAYSTRSAHSTKAIRKKATPIGRASTMCLLVVVVVVVAAAVVVVVVVAVVMMVVVTAEMIGAP